MKHSKKLICLAMALLMMVSILLSACKKEEEEVGTPLSFYQGEQKDEDGRTVYNTELFYSNQIRQGGPDPQVLDDTARSGYYYLYSTLSNFHTMRSKNLVEWDDVGPTFFNTQSEEVKRATYKDNWAPEVIYDPDMGKYLMFFSATPQNDTSVSGGENGIVDARTDYAYSYNLYLAVSDAPEGPFVLLNFEDENSCGKAALHNVNTEAGVVLSEDELEGKTWVLQDGVYYEAAFPHYFAKYCYLAPDKLSVAIAKNGWVNPGNPGEANYYGCIDPSPFVDPVTGEKFLYFKSEDRSWNVIMAVKMKNNNWLTPDWSTLTYVAVNGYYTVEDWENGENYGVSYEHTTCNEGPHMIYHKDSQGNRRYYLSYSMNSYGQSDYQVGTAVSDSPMGPFRKLTEEEGGLLVCSTTTESQTISGAGHHSYIKTGAQEFIIYHRHIDYDVGGDARYTAVDEMKWLKTTDINGNYLEVPYREAITRVVFEEGVTSVGSAFLYDLPNLTSVEIPASVTFIGAYAFTGCSSLEALHLPYGLVSIGGYAFLKCSSLASVSIPSTLTDLGTRAFAGCSGLEWVTVAAPLTELKGSTFDGCTSLEWIALREGLTTLGGRDFYNCTSLSEIRYTGDPTDIADVTFPEGEAEIYHRYFYQADVTQITLATLLSYEDATEPDDLRTYPTVTISDTLSKTYDGLPVDRLPQFSSNSGGAITVSWRHGAELCPTPPTLPGIYTVVLDVAETAQHYGGRFTLLFEIGQAQGTITLQSTALDREADGTPVTAPAYTYNGDAQVCVTWLCGGAQLPEAPSLPGAYTLRVYAPETLCYSAAVAEVNFVLSAPAGITIWDGSVATDFAGGSGTAEAPYLIANGAQLALLAQRVTEEGYASAHYRLTQDIYLNDCLSAASVWAEAAPGNMWSSIGTADAPFAGVFDGAGHSIFGLYVSTTNGTYACGLFGSVVGGTVKDLDLAYLSLNAPNRSATCYSGAVMAYGDGVNVSDISISECYITAARMGGGLVGALKAACGNSILKDCTVHVTNDATGIYSSTNMGGAAGTLQAGDRQYTTTLRNITVSGRVAASGYAGGMIGRTDSNAGLLLEDCTNRAAVSVTGAYAAGMVTTLNNTTGSCNVVLRNCVNHGAVTAGGNYASGMVCTATTRASTLTLVDCTNHGAITADDYAAGILCTLTANNSANAAVSFVRVSSDGVISGGTHAASLVAEITGDTENPYVTFEGCD